MKFLTQVFQDIDGNFSAKRTAFFILIGLLVSVFMTVTFLHLASETLTFLSGGIDKLTTLIEWLGGFIVAERAQTFAPKKTP